MKNIFVFALLLPLILIGCKFESPLTEKPTRNVDPALLGTWISRSGEKPINVYRLSNTEYLAIESGRPYVCTHSDLGHATLLSCRPLTESPEKYVYIAYTLDRFGLTLIPLNKSVGLDEKNSAEQNRRLLEKALKEGTALDRDPENQLRYKKSKTKLQL